MSRKRRIAATISVEWGYELHSLSLDREDWEAIKSGEEISIDGDGYSYEGEEFDDQWRFKGGVGGPLLVLYGDDGGVGYEGTLDEYMIEVHGD